MSSPSAPSPLGSSHWEQSRLHTALRKTSRGLAARLLSIEHDALHALHLHTSLGPALPLFANARAGAWYLPPAAHPAPTLCAFKSADGHYGHWSSSLRRPNIHLLSAATAAGAAVVVDVTRAGKHWPDSLSKTLPIWCAVLNILLGLSPCKCPSRTPADQRLVCPHCAPLHLHPSVPASERAQILARLPHWVAAWRRAGPALHAIVPAFAEARARPMPPLRPLWVAPGRPLWDRGLPLHRLDFTPIVCISASRQVPQGDRAFVEPRPKEEVVCGVRFPSRGTGFAYVQGAGDDEEAWSHGLTPQLFWAHREELLRIAAGQDVIAGAVDVERMLLAKVQELLQRALPCSAATGLGLKTGMGLPIWKSRIRLARTPATQLDSFATAAAKQHGAVVFLGSSRPTVETPDGRNIYNDNPLLQKVTFVPLTDRRGKVEYKYAFGRALGPCLSLLRACCVDKREQVLVCCNGKSGDWAAGLAIAWLAWHCLSVPDVSLGEGDSSDAEDLVDRVERVVYAVDETRKERVGEIPKEVIHATMLHFTSTYPQFQISRATLKQLNRFFSSPTPSSTVSDP